MKKTIVTLGLMMITSSAFAAKGPLLTCESADHQKVKIQVMEETPFGKNSMITINGNTYYGMRHHSLSQPGEEPKYVHCISEEPITAKCSYSDEYAAFVEVTYENSGKLKQVRARALDLNIDCAKSTLIWK